MLRSLIDPHHHAGLNPYPVLAVRADHTQQAARLNAVRDHAAARAVDE